MPEHVGEWVIIHDRGYGSSPSCALVQRSDFDSPEELREGIHTDVLWHMRLPRLMTRPEAAQYCLGRMPNIPLAEYCDADMVNNVVTNFIREAVDA